IFGSKNFQNGKYKGGQEVILETVLEFFGVLGEKNIIEEETNKVIEDKFGETINLVEKSFENKGRLLRKLRDILGEKEFFPEEPGDGIPPGREGMRRDPEAIAMQNADKQARIDAIANNVKTAEGIYKDAILKAAEIVGEDKPLNDLEKNRINKATTPEKIQAVLADIPKKRREK
ncbi:3902_t:CDS:2, partial [Funneliformis geosporum]